MSTPHANSPPGSGHADIADYDEFIDSVDAVAFAVPPDVQSELALRAVEAGKHVLLEKPIAVSVAAADLLVEAVDRAGVASVVFHTILFDPRMRAIMADVPQQHWTGGAGLWLGSALRDDNPFNTPWRRDKGALWDLGPHAVSVLRTTLGPIVAARGVPGEQDLVHAVFQHESGASSTASMTLWAADAADGFSTVLWGENGRQQLPVDDVDEAQALQVALAELTQNALAGVTQHPSDVRFGREIVAVLAGLGSRTAQHGGHVVTDSLEISFPKPNQVAVGTVTVPAPAPGELLCEARVSLLSTGTETFCLAGEFDPGTFWEEWVSFPFSPGYSMTSVVLAVGDDVSGFAIGDRVASQTPHAQRFIVPAGDAIAIPDDITDEQAAWMSLACTTQLGVRRADLQLGETVGVVGLGLLGQLVVQYLRVAGAGRIVAIDTADERLDRALRHGATDVIAAAAGDARERVAELTGGAMLDVVFDITGHHAVLAEASTLLRPLGRLVLLGDSPSPSRQHLGPRIVGDSISILGVHASIAPPVQTPRDRWTIAAMTELFFLLLRTGRMDVDGLISHRFEPADAPDVYARLQSDRSEFLGVLFDWSGIES